MNLTQEMVAQCFSYADVCRLIGTKINPYRTRAAKELTKNLNVSHFHPRNTKKTPKKPRVEKTCKVCGRIFLTISGSPKEKTVCSRSCANSHFRSGENHPNWKKENELSRPRAEYRLLAFANLTHRCNRCGWDLVPQVLEVHHKDRDKTNNNLSNLEIICPTCHNVEHYLSKDGKWKNKEKS